MMTMTAPEADAPAVPWISPDLAVLLARLTDAQVFACTLYGEARSETASGIVGVGWTIRHRVEADLHGDDRPDWWGEGYRGVCLAPFQFSCWSHIGGDRNHRRVLALVRTLAAGDTVTDPAAKECIFLASGLMKGWLRDPTKGATHYHTTTMAPRPKWAQTIAPLTQVGGHVFYRV